MTKKTTTCGAAAQREKQELWSNAIIFVAEIGKKMRFVFIPFET